jgi:transposase-like protein
VEDYPRTISELEDRFSTEDACRSYLSALRWPGGFVCPHCSTPKGWAMTRGLWLCAGCRRQVSVTAGTIFEGTRLPLVFWFRVMWYVTSQKNGASALGLHRVLGFGSYRTAWTWLHKLRRAMVRPGRERLSGTVEVDETYVGGEEDAVFGRQTLNKTVVVIAVEIHSPRGFGRVRMHPVAGVAAADLTPFVLETIQPGSIVHTDGWSGYNEIVQHGYHRHKTVISASGDPAHVALPGVHRIAALLKRWLLGTHQGAVSQKHLDYYLDEFTFRFNRRASASRGKLFYRLVQQAVNADPAPYRAIIGKNEVE